MSIGRKFFQFSFSFAIPSEGDFHLSKYYLYLNHHHPTLVLRCQSKKLERIRNKINHLNKSTCIAHNLLLKLQAGLRASDVKWCRGALHREEILLLAVDGLAI